jgi:hypothetical protein
LDHTHAVHRLHTQKQLLKAGIDAGYGMSWLQCFSQLASEKEKLRYNSRAEKDLQKKEPFL